MLKNVKFLVISRVFYICNLRHWLSTSKIIMECAEEVQEHDQKYVIKEGEAVVLSSGKVFYNPVQAFNRDLSISVINVYIQQIKSDSSSVTENATEPEIKILEALAASGLRSVRYAKELCGNKKIVANDVSKFAFESIEKNIKDNGVENVVEPSHNDAILLMHQHKQKGKQFDVIDLDPYGCPAIFLDSAVQAVKDGGLLLVTATDMAILAGNCPETCYVKYGAVSLKIKSCHEMALRILLQCIESHANRYGRYIEPILSLSADFYIRVFVKVYSGASKCKRTISKLSMVYHCTGCGTFLLHPLGDIKTNSKNQQLKYCLPTVSITMPSCEHCGHRHHMGGPIWSAPIHSQKFVREVLEKTPETLGTYRRIQGMLSVILEEIPDIPLYYTMEKFSGTLHVETPSMLAFRSAILNAGYQVSFSHTNKTAVKTNAPPKILWDIMRCWEVEHPSKRKDVEGSPAAKILSVKAENKYSFDLRSDANPNSRKIGLVRFQENPLPFWGPGTRSTAMIGGDSIAKSRKNQNKRKRDEEGEVIL